MSDVLILPDGEKITITGAESYIVTIHQGSEKIVLTIQDLYAIIDFINLKKP